MVNDKSAELCSQLYDVCQTWAKRHRPSDWPVDVAIKRLPRPGYEGDNAYNGFSSSERRTGEQVAQVLRRRGVLSIPARCDICGKTERIGFHGEDYFDPFSYAHLCFPCHMALHRRFASPKKWLSLLAQHEDNPLIDDFLALPMEEVDLATWLRTNTDGPHDVVKRVWGDRDVPEYQPRTQQPDYMGIIKRALPSEIDVQSLRVLVANPGATAAELSAAMGWTASSGWHLHFGKFCRSLEPEIGPAPVVTGRRNSDGTPARFFIGLLADFDPITRGFTIKPAVAKSLNAWLERSAS